MLQLMDSTYSIFKGIVIHSLKMRIEHNSLTLLLTTTHNYIDHIRGYNGQFIW